MTETPPKKSFLPSLKNSFPVILCIFLGIGLFLASYTAYEYFQIQDISIHAKGGKLTKLQGMDSIDKKPIFIINVQELEKTIVTYNPEVKEATVEKEYPNKLIINIIILPEIAALQTKEGFFILNAEGRIIRKTSEAQPKLPVITYYQQLPYRSYQAGDSISQKDIQYSLFFLQKARELGLQINSIDIPAFYMLGLYIDKKKILFTAEKDKGTQAYQLEMIIKQFNIEGKEFTMLDLRFDKPIVTF